MYPGNFLVYELNLYQIKCAVGLIHIKGVLTFPQKESKPFCAVYVGACMCSLGI